MESNPRPDRSPATDPQAQIAADIDALRARFPQTRELYREVCALLFFRYGITPTANRLYQYVRKGSMATPAQALARFWSDLRERSRVRIEHPELPEELRQTAGELVLQLWARAQEGAARGYREQASAAAAQVEAARHQAQEAEEEAAALGARLETMSVELAGSRGEAVELGRQLATIQGRLASMTEMLRDQTDEMRELREELATSRRDVARALGEANALRVQLALARQRGRRRPLGGVPQDPDPGQEHLALDPDAIDVQDASVASAARLGREGDPGADVESGADVDHGERIEPGAEVDCGKKIERDRGAAAPDDRGPGGYADGER